MSQSAREHAATLSLALLWLCLLLWKPSVVHADVQRFAIVIGSNLGHPGETPLRYAESDATRVYEVLRDLGGFAPANMLLLKGEDARTVEETIIAVNERVRTALSDPTSQALLFVYYSGHADASALHLGATKLPTRLFSQLVHGSAATFRLMVLDACRSGIVTRTKGGQIVRGGALAVEDSLSGSGLAVLAASAAHEDAQESDAIGGSFFTHAFVSGLLGAADDDEDGAVSLSEAYHYAYAATLRATSRSAAGTQHPTFRYDFAGQSSVVLTRPAAFERTRGVLQFPDGVGFLVLRDGEQGSVVAEVGSRDRRRALSVRPGAYFVRGRGQDVLFEGRVSVAAGDTRAIDTSEMNRVEYAQLVRKGGHSAGLSHAVAMGPAVRSLLSNADTPCIGMFAAYGVELEHFGLRGRAGACTSRFDNPRVQSVVNEYDLELGISHTWDITAIALELGLGAGAALFTQRFTTKGVAEPRNSLSPYLLIAAGTQAELGAGVVLGLGLAGETHFLKLEHRRSSNGPISTQFALRMSAVLGRSF